MEEADEWRRRVAAGGTCCDNSEGEELGKE